jgi:hypothetical protein
VQHAPHLLNVCYTKQYLICRSEFLYNIFFLHHKININCPSQGFLGWDATYSCRRYQCFRGSCCLHVHFTLKMKMAKFSETLVSYHKKRDHNLEDINLQHYENLVSNLLYFLNLYHLDLIPQLQGLVLQYLASHLHLCFTL